MKNYTFAEWLAEGGNSSMRFALNQSYSRISWAYSCINAIALAASGVPLSFYKGSNQSKTNLITDTDHPIYQLFNPPKASSIVSFRELVFRTFVYLGIRGLTYWVFERVNGVPVNVELKTSTQLVPIFSEPFGKGVLIGYKETLSEGKTKIYKLSDVVPIMFFNPDSPFAGLSPLSAARLSLEGEFNIAAWNNQFFKNGLKTPLILETSRQLTVDQKKDIRKEINDYYAGTENTQGAFLASGGLVAKPVALAPKDVDFIEGKKLNREEICFVPGTKVFTLNGLKVIEDIVEGDEVLTHTGIYKPVTLTMKRFYKGKVVGIKAKGLDEVFSTPNHPFFVSQYKRQRIDGSPKISLFNEGTWKQADSINVRSRKVSGTYSQKEFDCLTLPLLSKETTRTFIDVREFISEPLKRSKNDHTSKWIIEQKDGKDYIRSNISTSKFISCEIPLNKTFARLLGFFIAEGNAGDFTPSFNFGPTEMEYVVEVIQGVKELFGIDCKIIKTEYGLKVSVFNKIVAAILNECGRGAANKKIPQWALEAGKEFLDSLLSAYVAGDGCRSFYNTPNKVRSYARISTRSETLAWQIKLLKLSDFNNASLLKLDAFTTYIDGREVKSNGESYVVSWYDDVTINHVNFSDKKAHFFVKEKKYIDYEGFVYNLSVKDDESYTTTGGISHNCSVYGVPPAIVGLFEFSNYCVTGDTLITLEDGSTKPIIEVNVGEKVLTMGETAIEAKPVVRLWENGSKDIYEVKTGSRTLKCSQNHKFYKLTPGINPAYLRQKVWCNAEDLKIGDYVAVVETFSEKEDTSLFSRVWNYSKNYLISVITSLPKGLVWQKVRTLTLLPKEDTFDLEIEGTHNYFANWMVTHNSNTKEQRKIFWENTLLPKMEMIVDLLQINILNKDFPGITVAWDISAVSALRTDPIEVSNAAKIYAEMGVPLEQIAKLLRLPDLEPTKDWKYSKFDLISKTQRTNNARQPKLPATTDNGAPRPNKPPTSNDEPVDNNNSINLEELVDKLNSQILYFLGMLASQKSSSLVCDEDLWKGVWSDLLLSHINGSLKEKLPEFLQVADQVVTPLIKGSPFTLKTAIVNSKQIATVLANQLSFFLGDLK